MLRLAGIACFAAVVIVLVNLAPGCEHEAVKVGRVIDGDTFETADGMTVRVIGYDAPELGECGGAEATRALAELVEGQTVELTEGAEAQDSYGRALRHAHIGSQMVSEAIVRRGWGETMTVPPNGRHAALIASAEREAREAGRGIWGECR